MRNRSNREFHETALESLVLLSDYLTHEVSNLSQSSAVSKEDSLKFVIHFVGDVHQPLHAGFRSDLVSFEWQGLIYPGRKHH